MRPEDVTVIRIYRGLKKPVVFLVETFIIIESFFILVSLIFRGDLLLGISIGIALWLCFTFGLIVAKIADVVLHKAFNTIFPGENK
jgi:hypothetical protein